MPGGLPLGHLNEQLQQHYNSEGVHIEDPGRVTAEPEQITASDGNDHPGLTKSNSLSRSGVASGGRFKKPGAARDSAEAAGGLARTAHANNSSKKNSLATDVRTVESLPGFYGSNGAGGGARGVQLSDRPMDDY